MSSFYPKRVLVVDDEPHILSVLALKLGNAGYDVRTASDGEEGYTAAVSERPDLLITDYSMPFLSGLELCQRLKQNPVTREMPALMLTARGMGLTPESLDGTNILAVVSKPFSPREILSKVSMVLETGSAGGAAS
jgi:two-component system, OmpR family, alkaline phosphatase synthesis response regulator PhoP